MWVICQLLVPHRTRGACAYGESDLLRNRMTVHDRRVARADDVLVVEDGELRLELAYSMDRGRRAREHEPGADVFVVDTAQTDPHVVTAERGVNLFLDLVIDRCNLNDILVRHEQ